MSTHGHGKLSVEALKFTGLEPSKMQTARGILNENAPDSKSGTVPVARWRVVLGVLVLVLLLALGGFLFPVYLRNLEFQRFVSAVADDPRTRATNDALIRSRLVDKADELKLPVRFENIQIGRTAETVNITVRYVVHVNLLVYAVDLHFYPGAGSR